MTACTEQPGTLAGTSLGLKGVLAMARVGILTFSDGRAFVAEQVEEMNRGFQERLKRRL